MHVAPFKYVVISASARTAIILDTHSSTFLKVEQILADQKAPPAAAARRITSLRRLSTFQGEEQTLWLQSFHDIYHGGSFASHASLVENFKSLRHKVSVSLHCKEKRTILPEQSLNKKELYISIRSNFHHQILKL